MSLGAERATGLLAGPGRTLPRARVRAAALARPLTVGLLAAAALAVSLRAPFWNAPLTADEGGYAEVARLWSHGARLYRDVFVDRPQGLLLVFRALRAVGLGSTEGLRVAAAAVALLLLAATALVTARLAGRRAAVLCAGLMAVAGSSPYIESFTLSGELLASLPAVLSLLAFTSYLRSGRAGALVAAGLLSGCALTIKQSGFDAALAAVAWLLLTERRRSPRHVGLFGAALLAPLLAAALTAPSLREWWFAVVGYRGVGDSIVTGSLGARLHLLSSSLPAAAAALGLPALLAALGWRRGPRLARLWLAAAVLGVIGGGNFHPHYYQQLAPPLCLLAAAGLERELALRPRRAAVAAGLAAAAVVALPGPLWLAPPAEQAQAIWPHDPHLTRDAAAAAYVRAHTRPERKVFVIWAAADVYYLADRRPALRYLWFRNVQAIPGALAQARIMLASRRAALVVEAQGIDSLDRTGESGRILRRNYALAARIGGVAIYRPRSTAKR